MEPEDQGNVRRKTGHEITNHDSNTPTVRYGSLKRFEKHELSKDRE